jgi:hypothetical protein
VSAAAASATRTSLKRDACGVDQRDLEEDIGLTVGQRDINST